MIRLGRGDEEYHIVGRDVDPVFKYAKDLYRHATLGDKADMSDPFAFGSRSEPSSPVAKRSRNNDWP